MKDHSDKARRHDDYLTWVFFALIIAVTFVV